MAGLAFVNQNQQAIMAPNFQSPVLLTGTLNGSNKAFSFPSDPGFSFVITIGGVWQTPEIDYTWNAATHTATFTNAPLVQPVGYW